MPVDKIYYCTWSGCSLSFTRNDSLRRHICNVHKKERTHVCNEPKCGASFCTAYDLKRHRLRVHINERNFKCSQCPKAFKTRDELRRHARDYHGTQIKTSRNTLRVEKPSYECAECGYSFVRKGDLIRHISAKHGNEEYFECHTCEGRYSSKKRLETHIFAKHYEPHPISMKKSRLCCIICKKLFQYCYQVENHYQKFHHIALHTEKHIFPTMQDFSNWKQNIENFTTTRFRLRKKSKWRFVYVCHRSGPIHVKLSDRKRANILRGSKKVDGMCPASITLCLNRKDSSCVATFVQTHVGHELNDKTELKYCFFRPKDREKLAEMVASGIPKSRIRDYQTYVQYLSIKTSKET